MSAATLDLQDLRRELPRGPEPKSALDTIVEQLTAVTNSTGLHERLVSWGWVAPDGNSRTWDHWQAIFPQTEEKYYASRKERRTR
jgi:hypothetical protein